MTEYPRRRGQKQQGQATAEGHVKRPEDEEEKNGFFPDPLEVARASLLTTLTLNLWSLKP